MPKTPKDPSPSAQHGKSKPKALKPTHISIPKSVQLPKAKSHVKNTGHVGRGKILNKKEKQKNPKIGKVAYRDNRYKAANELSYARRRINNLEKRGYKVSDEYKEQLVGFEREFKTYKSTSADFINKVHAFSHGNDIYRQSTFNGEGGLEHYKGEQSERGRRLAEFRKATSSFNTNFSADAKDAAKKNLINNFIKVARQFSDKHINIGKNNSLKDISQEFLEGNFDVNTITEYYNDLQNFVDYVEDSPVLTEEFVEDWIGVAIPEILLAIKVVETIIKAARVSNETDTLSLEKVKSILFGEDSEPQLSEPDEISSDTNDYHQSDLGECAGDIFNVSYIDSLIDIVYEIPNLKQVYYGGSHSVLIYNMTKVKQDLIRIAKKIAEVGDEELAKEFAEGVQRINEYKYWEDIMDEVNGLESMISRYLGDYESEGFKAVKDSENLLSSVFTSDEEGFFDYEAFSGVDEDEMSFI